MEPLPCKSASSGHSAAGILVKEPLICPAQFWRRPPGSDGASGTSLTALSAPHDTPCSGPIEGPIKAPGDCMMCPKGRRQRRLWRASCPPQTARPSTRKAPQSLGRVHSVCMKPGAGPWPLGIGLVWPWPWPPPPGVLLPWHVVGASPEPSASAPGRPLCPSAGPHDPPRPGRGRAHSPDHRKARPPYRPAAARQRGHWRVPLAPRARASRAHCSMSNQQGNEP